MKRLFWFGVGAAAGVMATRKVGETARKATPAGIAENVGDAMRELAVSIGAFGADVRAGMSEREGELDQMVQQRSGVPLPGARARRADDRAR